MTVMAFLFALAVLIAVHEAGHYGMAVASGVKVLRFSIGFGPKLLGWTSPRSGTEFVLCAVPLGGYVKMLDEREGPVEPHERARAFNVQSLRVRAAIVAAGPLANLVLAVALYAGVYWAGMQQAEPILGQPVPASVAERAGLQGGERVVRVAMQGDAWQEVRSFDDLRWWLTRAALDGRKLLLEWVPQHEAASPVRLAVLDLDALQVREADAQMFRHIGLVAPYSEPRLGELLADGAAAQAGLQSGDLVLRVDGVAMTDAAQLRQFIRQSAQVRDPAPQQWLVSRSGQLLTLAVSPRIEQDGDTRVGRVGAMIGSQPATTLVRYGVLDGVGKALQRTWEVSVLTLKMMGKIVIGEASVKNLSGPITLADYAGKSASMGWIPFILFLALVSISLGVLNLLPIPVLDGGHLVCYLWEWAAGRPLSEQWTERLQKVGMLILLAMMSIAISNDLLRLWG